MKQPVKLIFVEPGGVRGNNKFYDMKDNDNGTFTVSWGRVGATPSTNDYPINQWDKKYREKTKKGYTDVTEHFLEEAKDGTVTETKLSKDFKDDKPEAVKEIVRRLQQYANKSVSDNYIVSVASVTEKQVDAAQETLNKIAGIKFDQSRIPEINEALIKLYKIIPRKMERVDNYVLHTSNSAADNDEKFKKILQNEQDTLDVMAGQVKTLNGQKTQAKSDDTSGDGFVDIIEAAGLQIVEVTDEDVKIIKKQMQDKAKMFKRAFKVINNGTQSSYDAHLGTANNKKTALFWHGSRTENWWSIMTKGLMIRPSSAVYTGSMFGDGIYFASEFDKSLGYTSISGSRWARGGNNFAFLALYEVHLGKQYEIEHSDSSLSARKLKDKGNYDSTWGKKGRSLYRDEYIVYNAAQCTIKYLVEVEGSQY